MSQDLMIRLEADVTRAVKEVREAVAEIEELKPAGDKAADGVEEVEKAAAKTAATMRKTRQEVENVGTTATKTGQAATKAAAGVKKLGESGVNATPALTNLGRVISDAPFGIIGIANNIDPLLESFNRLGKQAGGTGGALKALFAGLAGPSGIAIGVTALTSSLIAFGPEISRAISGLSAFQNTLIEADFAGAEAFSKAKTEFRALIDIVDDGTLSAARQQKAFDDANSALGKYGLQIENLSTFQQQGARIGQIYAAIKREEAKASFLAEKAAEEYAKRIAITSKLQQGDVLGVFGQFSLGDQFATIFGGTGGGGVGFGVGFTNALKDATKAEDAFNKAIDLSNSNIQDLVKQLDAVPGVSEKFVGAKTKAAEASANAAKAQELELQTKKAVLAITTQEVAQLRALSTETEKRVKQLQQQALAQKSLAISGAGSPNVSTSNRGPAQAAIQASSQILAVQSQLGQVLQNNELIAAGLANQFGNIFEAIANGQNAFDVIKDSLRQLVVQIIRAIIQAAILKALTSAIGGSTFGGSFIGKSLLGALGGNRAGGGMVMPGMSYTVGEMGAETFIPSVPGSIVPAGGGMGGQFEFVIRGNTLRTVQQRANQSFNRIRG